MSLPVGNKPLNITLESHSIGYQSSQGLDEQG